MSNLQSTEPAALETVENEYWIELADALVRLEKNPDFKKVILEGYFKDAAIDKVSLLATRYIKEKGLRGEVIEQMVAISQLQDYFITIKNLGLIDDGPEVEAEKQK